MKDVDAAALALKDLKARYSPDEQRKNENMHVHLKHLLRIMDGLDCHRRSKVCK